MTPARAGVTSCSNDAAQVQRPDIMDIKITHHGGCDALTAAQAFWFDAQPEHHAAAFQRVHDELVRLSRVDIIHSPSDEPRVYRTNAVDLIAEIEHPNGAARLIAFRFTSDAAAHMYRDRLFELGASGLGRGIYEPFANHHFGSFWFGWRR